MSIALWKVLRKGRQDAAWNPWRRAAGTPDGGTVLIYPRERCRIKNAATGLGARKPA